MVSLVAVVSMFWADEEGYDLSLLQQIAVYATVMFACCMVCHGELVSLKPHADHLTSFYLMVALGGALGGVFANLVAPVVFTGFWEFQVGLVGTCLLLGLCLDLRREPGGRRQLLGDLAWAGGIGLMVFSFVSTIQDETGDLVLGSRNFYGVLRVYDSDVGASGEIVQRSLYHGEILHGLQLLPPELRREPLSYYNENSGLALVLTNDPMRALPTTGTGTPSSRGRHIGVIGLGTGTVAAYGRNG